MMHQAQFRELVARVIGRLAERLGASGEKGCLVVVFTAATVEFQEAVQQVCKLVLDGFRIQLAFSEAAKQLLAKAVMDRLAGFPHVSTVESSAWLGALRDARAVVVPLLSLNTLSKLSLLIADNTATNLILHALLMRKPVIIARNGADPLDKGRRELGFHKGRPPLAQTMVERLQIVAEYGSTLTDVGNLADTLNSLLQSEESARERPGRLSSTFPTPTVSTSKHFITAAEVLQAWRTGTHLSVGAATRLTPLAQELVRRYGVVVSSDTNWSI